MNSIPFLARLVLLAAILCSAPAAHAQRISSLPRTNTLQGAAASNLVMVTALEGGTNGSFAYAFPDFALLMEPYYTGVSGVSIATLNTTSNALVSYANGTTNASIVRQTQLTAASNALYSAIGGATGSNFVVSTHGTAIVTGEVSAATAVFSSSLNSQGDTTLSGSSGIAANRVLYLDIAKKIQTSSGVTPTELEYLDNVTGAIQTQLDSKPSTTILNTASNALVTYANGVTNASIVRQTELTAASNALYSAIGSGSGGTNPVALAAGNLVFTNYYAGGFTNLGSNAVQVIDMMGQQIADSFINGNTTIVLTNMPAWTNVSGMSPTMRIVVRHGTGTLTLASLHPIDFGDDGLFISSGKSNQVVTVRFLNGRLFGTVTDRSFTGSGSGVNSNAPVILNATLTTPTIASPTITGTATAGIVSNLQASLFQIALPAITQSNLLINPALTNLYECVGLTNAVLTNLVELATGLNGKARVTIRNTTGSSVAVALPAFGAQHGYYFHTNGLNDVLSASVAPPGTNTVYSLEFDGTNIYPTVTYWRHP